MQAGTTVRVDLRDGTADDAGFDNPGIRFAKPSVSSDGRYVAFAFSEPTSSAARAITPGYPQAYVRDVTGARTYLLNRAADGSFGRYGPAATERP